jgi:polysaccharide export outer membrane protein
MTMQCNQNEQRNTVYFLLLLSLTFGSSTLCAQQPAWVNANVDREQSAVTKKPANGNQSAAVTAVPEDFSKMLLGPGFLLALQVYNAPEMSLNLRVDDAGTVNIPLAGSVHIGGQTVAAAEKTIAQALESNELFKNPQVSLNIVQYSTGSVNVLGEVQSPGRIPLLAPRSLADILSLAGGETPAAGEDIEIKCTVDGQERTEHVRYAPGSNVDSLQDLMISPGMTVYVHKAGIIYVLGSVARPGGYLLINGGALDVMQALALAQGTNPTAAVGSIRIIRKKTDGSIAEIHVPYKQIAAGKIKAASLEHDDVVYVPASKLKAAMLAGTGVLATTAGAAIYVVH